MRQREHEVAALAVLGPDARAVPSAKPARDREAEAGAAPVAAALEGVEHELARRRSTPRPLVEHVQAELVVARLDAERTGVSAGENFSALSSRFTSARSICTASTWTGRRVRVELDHDPLAARARAGRARARRDRRPSRARDAARRRRSAGVRGRASCRRAGRAGPPRRGSSRRDRRGRRVRA